MSCRVSVAVEAHTVAETLLKPSAAEIRSGNNRKRNLTTVDLTNNTVTRRSQDLSANTEKKAIGVATENPILLVCCALTNQQTRQG